MLTRLGFKFSVLVCVISLIGMVIQAQTPLDPVEEPGIVINHESMLPASPHNLLDTVSLQPMPSQADTLGPQTFSTPNDSLNLQPFVLDADTLEFQVERYRGSANVLDARVDYSASDSIFFDLKNQKVFLYGDADLTYGNIHLVAAFVELDFRTNELYAKGMPDSLGVIQGNPQFTEGDQSFESEELRYNFETKRGRTINVITEEADGFVHGHFVKIQPNKVVHVQDGKYTTCDDPDPHFHIGFRKAKLIPNDKIITSVAFLVIEKVPMPLFIPFGFFPNKRGQASGILMPSYGEAANRGFYLENGGFYMGINDYVDLSLRGDIYSRGSWGLRLGSTYRVRYRYNGNVNLNYAINVLGERDLPGYSRSRDFRIVWSHNQDPKARPNSTFRANVNAGSSQSTRFNPESERDYLSNTFSSNISYSAAWAGRYNFSANARHSQNTINRTVDLSLPEVAFSVSRIYPFRKSQSTGRLRWYEDINFTYSMNARNEIRAPDSLLFGSETWSQMRNGVNHVIPLSYSTRVLNHLNLSTSINYNERWYFSTIEKRWDDTFMRISGNDTIYGREKIDTMPGFKAARDFSFSSGLSTRIYGQKAFAKGPVKAIRHVMSPSMSFSFRPDFADPFWGYYRHYYNPERNQDVRYSIFEGALYSGPQPNRSGNLSFNVTNNLEMKVQNKKDTITGDRKISLIDNFTISGGYDMARDSLNWSDIRLSGRTRLFGNFDVTYSSSYTLYARNDAGGYINRFLLDTEDKLLKLNNTSWALSFNYNIGSDQAGSGERTGAMSGGDMTYDDPMDMAGDMNDNGMDEMGRDTPIPTEGIDFSVPWSLNFSYSFNYNSRYQHHLQDYDRSYIQNLSVSGNVALSPKWRIGFRSGFDFDRKEITYTSVDIYRDLHCWEMTLNWIPFGFRQSYNFTLRVKSSVLQDLKLTRRTHHLDRAF